MKQTRKIFVLNDYSRVEEKILLHELKFKALVVFYSKEVTENELVNVFENNKSALCISCKLPKCYEKKSIVCNNLNFDESIIKQFEDFAISHNCDIGDHKSNSSGLSGTPTAEDCAYCKFLNGSSGTHHTILYSSANFFVMCTLGQFINGYLLIIPYDHIMSNAELNESKRKEFQTVLDDISYILKMTYNVSNVLVFENGTGNSGIGKAKNSVVHSHTHIVPSELNADKIKMISGFPFEEISFEQLPDYTKESYLLIQKSASSWIICQNPNLYIPRQYVRQLLADEYSIPGECWNWRIYGFEDKMHETDKQIMNTLKTNWDKLPERIKERTKMYLF
mgnify:FL=1